MGLIKKPNELTVKNALSALIYGQPGMGKTTLALSSPQPLLLDFDGGVHRVNAAHRVDTVQISKWEEVDEVLTSGEIAEYKTIVIDTAGKMLSFMDKYIMKNNPKMKKADGTLSLQGYGVRKNMFINFVNQVTLMGKSVIFVAHEREEKNGEDKQIRPEIGGSSAGDLIKELDLVGYMEAIGKDRTISFDPCEKFYGKNTCNLPARIKIPVIINAEGIGHSTGMARRIEAATGIETRATILGYMQRGGSPTCKDRMYASIMGAYAVDLLTEGKSNRLVAYKDGKFVDYDIDEALAMTKDINDYEFNISALLSK